MWKFAWLSKYCAFNQEVKSDSEVDEQVHEICKSAFGHHPESSLIWNVLIAMGPKFTSMHRLLSGL